MQPGGNAWDGITGFGRTNGLGETKSGLVGVRCQTFIRGRMVSSTKCEGESASIGLCGWGRPWSELDSMGFPNP